MADFTAEVVRYLRQKTDEGFDSVTYLGAEQRFVNALRNSGVNNLEEQYIIGTDTYSIIYFDDDGNSVEEKEFRLGSSTNNYYKLITIDYTKGIKNTDFFFGDDEEELRLPSDSTQVIWGELDGEEVLMCEDIDTFSVSGITFIAAPSTFMTTKTEDLYFVSDGSEIHVLGKTTDVKYVGDKQHIKEAVTNYLKS